MPQPPQRSWQEINEAQHSSNAHGTFAYTPIDPFKPSLAFSIQNLALGSPGDDRNVLEDDRPPIRRHRRYIPPVVESTRSQVPRYNPHSYQNSFTRPAWRSVPPRVKHKPQTPMPTQNAPARPRRYPSPTSDVGSRSRSRSRRRFSHSRSRSSSRSRSRSRPRNSVEHRVMEGRPPLTETPMELRQELGLASGDVASVIPSETSECPEMCRNEDDIGDNDEEDDEEDKDIEVESSKRDVLKSKKEPLSRYSRSDMDHSTCGSGWRTRPRSRRSAQELPPALYSRTHSTCSPRRTSFLYRDSQDSLHQEAREDLELDEAPPDLFTVLPYSSDTKVQSPALSTADKTEDSSNTSTAFGRGSQKLLNSTTKAYLVAFVVDTLPRQIYLNLHLRLPYLYFSRVTRIFEEAEMSMPMIRQGILDAARANAEARGQSWGTGQSTRGWGTGEMMKNNWGHWDIDLETSRENAAYMNLQNTWLSFVDALLKEWKTLNIISVLLLSAILTILQIESAASDPLTRYSALLSMICALMSLVYGCVYIIRFGTMKKTYKGAAWAQEAQKLKAGIWWNIWVLLAMPATWLAWSVILYIVTITAFIWRTSPFQSQDPPNTTLTSTSPQLLIPRILISMVLSLGILYFILIALTLRRYGEMMDRAWQKRIWGWLQSAEDPETVEPPKEQAQSWHTWQPEDREVSEDEGEEEYSPRLDKNERSRDVEEQASHYHPQVFAPNIDKALEPTKLYEPRNIDGWGMPFSCLSGTLNPANKPVAHTSSKEFHHVLRFPENTVVLGGFLPSNKTPKANLVDTSATAVETGDSRHSALGKVESQSSLSKNDDVRKVGCSVKITENDVPQVVRLPESSLNVGDSSNDAPLLPNEASIETARAVNKNVGLSPENAPSPIEVTHTAAAEDVNTGRFVCAPDREGKSRDDEREAESGTSALPSQLKDVSTILGDVQAPRIKLFDLPLPESFMEIIPLAEDLGRCGLNLDAFGLSEFGEDNGWNDFKKHIHASLDPSNAQPADSSFGAIQDPLSFVLDLWNAKLEFNGVTGCLASCEAGPGDPRQAIYYMHERRKT